MDDVFAISSHFAARFFSHETERSIVPGAKGEYNTISCDNLSRRRLRRNAPERVSQRETGTNATPDPRARPWPETCMCMCSERYGRREQVPACSKFRFVDALAKIVLKKTKFAFYSGEMSLAAGEAIRDERWWRTHKRFVYTQRYTVCSEKSHAHIET